MHPTHPLTWDRARPGAGRRPASGASSSSSTTPTAAGTACPPTPSAGHPTGLLTIRQLRAKGLRPGGQDIAAQILWRRRRARTSAASPTSTAMTSPCPSGTPPPPSSPPSAKALRARRTCPTCGTEKDLLHPALNGRMQRLRGRGVPMTAPPSGRRSGVNRSLTPKRRRRVTENDEYAAFLRRAHPRLQPPRRLRRHRRPRRHGRASPPTSTTPSRDAVTGLRTGHGYSWADIALRLGISRQAAQQRWGGEPP